MRLLLIRHGQTQSNLDHILDTAYPGAPLTELGHQQAESLVNALADEPIDAIYASTLTRAQQTAAPVAKARGLEVQIIDGIQEISAGVEEMSSDWTAYVGELASWSEQNMDSRLEGGESAREFLARFGGAVQKMADAGDDNVAVFSHGAAIRVWGLTHGGGISRDIAVPLNNTQSIEFEGSPDQGWKLKRWALTTIG